MCQYELDDKLSWLLSNVLSATRYIKLKKMGITEILRRIWLFSANKIKSSESFSKQSTQLIVELNSSLRHIIVTLYSLMQRQIQIFIKFNYFWQSKNKSPVSPQKSRQQSLGKMSFGACC